MSDRPVPRFCNPNQAPEKFDGYPRDFDMIDSPEQIEYWSLLREPLEEAARVILPVYQEVDRDAQRHQDRHRRLSAAGVVAGTVAVLIAIFQLAFPEVVESLGGWRLSALETVAALLALVAVVTEIFIAFKARWLLLRHKAERLRLLKFQFLINPSFWLAPDPSRDPIRRRLDNAVEDIKTIHVRRFRSWTEELDDPDLPREPQNCPFRGDLLEQLIDYYRVKRIVYQRSYFHDRAHRFVHVAWVTGWLAGVLFFGSVACVFIHYVIEGLNLEDGAHVLSFLFIFLAAALPAASAGIRALKEEHQFARNRVRYHAKELGLDFLDTVLQRTTDPTLKYRDLEFCERVLGLEHREWARLMSDTEIFP